jgi:hypothetical protein
MRLASGNYCYPGVIGEVYGLSYLLLLAFAPLGLLAGLVFASSTWDGSHPVGPLVTVAAFSICRNCTNTIYMRDDKLGLLTLACFRSLAAIRDLGKYITIGYMTLLMYTGLVLAYGHHQFKPSDYPADGWHLWLIAAICLWFGCHLCWGALRLWHNHLAGKSRMTVAVSGNPSHGRPGDSDDDLSLPTPGDIRWL